ncbi:TetR/AcrR family transcriptional regulator [Gordonia sp. ABSL1-1]|uniref:TetR/AcrR family transcriptional regulator n=1 Tax=Gordonia sp. ABSL1-1 TaxID=3053923 RepID=UPI00257293FA|nr:TetR/AcrR family transcriptional regulator [Gordonia sp. ABSL1-1]MDL9936837.1 TetR/AcrR family transcriptional regulator [Gordonia sp. ABSL1-1]
MEVNRRTQAERTAATRGALISAGRRLFGEHGYADVGTQAVVDAAGVTRGALYHQFGDKQGLFSAVYDDVEQTMIAEIGERIGGLLDTDPIGALRAATGVALEIFAQPEVQRIGLVDAPVVLGWKEWRARGEDFGFALIEGLLRAAVDAGQIEDQPLRPIAHVAIGALDEAALYVAAADDRDVATVEMTVVLNRVIDAFLIR